MAQVQTNCANRHLGFQRMLIPEIRLQSRLHLSFLEQNCVYNDKDTPHKPNNPLHSPIKCDQHNRLYIFPLPWAIFQNNETSGISLYLKVRVV